MNSSAALAIITIRGSNKRSIKAVEPDLGICEQPATLSGAEGGDQWGRICTKSPLTRTRNQGFFICITVENLKVLSLFLSPFLGG